MLEKGEKYININLRLHQLKKNNIKTVSDKAIGKMRTSSKTRLKQQLKKLSNLEKLVEWIKNML